MTHINPLTVQIITQKVEAKSRKLNIKWSLQEDIVQHNQYIKQLDTLEFKVSHREGVREWIDQFGYKAKFNSDSHNPELYNVIFTKAADAAHFKLVWC